MTSKSANLKATNQEARLVVFLVYQNIVLLDLVGPLQVFSHAPDFNTGKNGYECVVASVNGDSIGTNTIVSIPSTPASQMLDRTIHTLVVVGGDGALKGMYDEELVATVGQLAAEAKRVCSICSGALILGATGLLDGRRAVTHWDDCSLLAEAFPKVQVEIDPIYIKDENVWTSAGITAGIDMALAIVAEDLGRASAFQVARSMVVQMVRTGGQSQFSPVLRQQLNGGVEKFATLHDWINSNLRKTLSVNVLAEQSNMSPRNFARVYTNTLGITPAKAVEAMRVEKARELLEGSNLPIKKISVQCGFNDEDRMRRAFVKLLKVTPSDYRLNFSTI